jgi:son of sevenless-like protein
MGIYDPSFNHDPIEKSPLVDRQVASPPFKPNILEQKLLFTLQNFKLDVGKLEPLFVTIYLFNTQKNCKISENYYYVVNTDGSLLKQVGADCMPKEHISANEIQKTIFTVEEPNPNIYIVIWVEKVLQYGGGVENYVKSKNKKTETAKSAVFSKIKEAWDNTPTLRMPLMWSFEPLFEVITSTATPLRTQSSDLIAQQKRVTGGSIGAASDVRQNTARRNGTTIITSTPSSGFNTRRSIANSNDNGETSVTPQGITSPTMLVPGVIYMTENQEARVRSGLLTMKNLYACDGEYTGKQKFEIGKEILLHILEKEKKNIKDNIINGYFLLEVDPLDFNKVEDIVYGENGIADEKQRQAYNDMRVNRPRGLLSELDEFHDYNEILRFYHQVQPLNGPQPEPFNMQYSHELYIYPDNVNFTVLGSKAKNIVLRLSLLDNDTETVKVIGMQNLVSRYNRNTRPLLEKHVTSSTLFHEKYPQFFDEFRINLPTPLSSKNHLLFQFYNVNVQQSYKSGGSDTIHEDLKVKSSDVSFLGSAVLKIVDKDHILTDGFRKLCVYKSLEANYLAEDEKKGDKDAKRVNSPSTPSESYANGKEIFRFTVLFKSALYPQDDRAMAFLRASANLLDKNTSASAANLEKFFNALLIPHATSTMEQLKFSKWEKIVPYVPIYINLLLYVMVNGKRVKPVESPDENQSVIAALTMKRAPSPIGMTIDDEERNKNSDAAAHAMSVAFETLLSLLRGVYRKHNCIKSVCMRDNHYLSTFIQYLFVNPKYNTDPLYLTLIELWDEFFRNSHRKEAERRTAALKDDEDGGKPKSAPTPIRSPVVSPETPTGDTKKTSRKRSVFIKIGTGIKGIATAVANKKDKNLKDLITVNDDDEPVNARVSLELSWFLFDLLSKSITMEAMRQDTDIGEDTKFFKQLRSLQHRVGESAIDLLNTQSADDAALARQVNLNLALFIRDLLWLCSLPHIAKSKFPTFVMNLLEDYLLITEIKKEACRTLRLEFVKLLADHERLVQISAHTEDQFVIRFITDVIHKSILEPETCEAAIDAIANIITRLDFDANLQTDDQRNEISKMWFGFVEKVVIDLNKLPKKLNDKKYEKHMQKLLITCVHIMKNRKRDQWEEWFTSQGPEFNALFIKMLSMTLRSTMDYGVKLMRVTIKISCLDIFNRFLTSMKAIMAKDPGSYSMVIGECVDYFVKFLDINTEDKMITEKLFLPSFREFVKALAPAMCKSDKDVRWKSALGACMKFAEFPLRNNADTVVSDSIEALLSPYEARLKRLMDGVEPFIEIEDDESNFLKDKNQIKAATLDKLIERVTSDKDMDPKFREVFFLTYRSFTKPFTLMEKLIQRFLNSHKESSAEGNKVTLRVINAIKLWVDKHFYDFDNPLVCRLVKFLEDTADIPTFATFCKNLKKSLSLKLMHDDEKTAREIIFSQAAPPSIFPKGFTSIYTMYTPFDIMAWSSKEFARQMTLVEYDYFKKIEPKECLSGAWAKASKKLFAPNIVALTERWNNMTGFVATTIISEDDIRVRKNLMIKFVEIAQELKEMNNFNGVTEIMSGLANVAIYRLKKTWDMVPPDVMQTHAALTELCNQNQANKNMRDALARAPPPAIPPLAMYLKDLTCKFFLLDY